MKIKHIVLTLLIGILLASCSNEEPTAEVEAEEETETALQRSIDAELRADTAELIGMLDRAYFDGEEVDEALVVGYLDAYEPKLEKEDTESIEKIIIMSVRRMMKLKDGASGPTEYEYERDVIADYIGLE